MAYGTPLLHTATSARTIDCAGDTTPPLRFASRTPSFLRALARLERFARHDGAIVVIEGESGTGKSYLAQHLHQCSGRARGPFQHVVLSTLDDNLAASDLFGHVTGAYTDARHSRPGHFVSAMGGTLFLDEIGKATMAVQRKLLHAVERAEIWPVGSDRAVRVDARIVVATNIPLAELAAEGKFLPDLLARLGGFEVCIPALRERADDIPLLTEQLVAQYAPRFGYEEELPAIDAPLMQLLQRAAWPGNLRQLDATVRRLLIEAEGAPVLTVAQLADSVLAFGSAETAGTLTLERVRQAMDLTGSASAAGRLLGVTRQTVYRYLARERPADA